MTRSDSIINRLDPGPRTVPVRSTPPCQPPPPSINATKLMREWRAATPAPALAAFASSLGVTPPSLVAVGAAWAAPHSAWAFPMCDGYENVVGIRLRNERGKFAVRGSRQGIFLAAGSPQQTLFVCEGPTDTAAAVDLGLYTIGRPSCRCGAPEIRTYIRRLSQVGRVTPCAPFPAPVAAGFQPAVQPGFQPGGPPSQLSTINYPPSTPPVPARVVVIADNDKPGIDGARWVGAELRLPFAIYVPPAKDLREFVRLGGTRTMIDNTLKGTLWQNG